LEFNVPFQHKYGYIRDDGRPVCNGSEGRPPIYKGHGSPSEGHVTKPKSFGAPGHSNASGDFQKSTPFGRNAKPHTGQETSATTAGTKFTQREQDMALGLCFHCKKPGHIRTACPKLHAESEQREAPVQLVSTLSSQVTQGQVSSTVVQKPQEVDPRFEGHCSLVTLVRPDHTRHIVRALRDTGALQLLVSQQSVSDCDYESTGDLRLIRSVAGETVSVPLDRVTLQSSMCSGGFLFPSWTSHTFANWYRHAVRE